MAASKTAGEILEAVVEDGNKELQRANAGLAFSGVAAGLNVSFSALALAVVGSMTGQIGLTAMLVYPVGFIIVILGRAQLFTENTVTPVTVALTDHRAIPNMFRLWAVIFLANLVGVTIFALVVVYAQVLTPSAQEVLLSYVADKLDYGFWTMALKAVFGGWLVALMAWLVAASQDTVSQLVFIWFLAFLIPAGGLTHSIVGSSEVLISVFANETSWSQFLGGFLLPATLGNIVGGLVLVTLLNYGQVIGSQKRFTRNNKKGASEEASPETK